MEEVMVLGCMSAARKGELVLIETNMDGKLILQHLKENIKKGDRKFLYFRKIYALLE